ncbi:MAG: tetratricopeptide repeat protein [Prevotellaceae bacterium]|jgi:tetratricopeptide (TPR) repeat protein|nr:tetratricopeptide repeat protein [Prevotellaceae bacterium]
MDKEDYTLIQKYEMLLYNKEAIYFDVYDFETIIAHYNSEERYADALEALVHAGLCHPEANELMLHKANILMCLDNFDRAFELLRDLDEKLPTFFEVNLYRGYIYLEFDDLVSAVKEFEIAFEKSPDLEAEQLQYIPEALIEDGHFEEAMPFLSKFIDSGKSNAKILFQTGLCYDKLSEPEEAEKYYEKSLDEDPFNDKTWVALGVLYMASGRAEKAMEAYDFALSINKDNTLASLCKSTVLIQSGDFEKAIGCIMDILDTSPDDADSLYSLGECYEKKYNLQEAEDCYIQAIEQGTRFADPYWGLAKMRYNEKNFEAAIKTIDRALEFEPNDEKYISFRGKCLVHLFLDPAERCSIDETFERLNIEMNYYSDKSKADKEFTTKHKKAVFFYNLGEMEQCCKYLLESMKIKEDGLDMFFEIIPKAKDDAFIINYLGKYFK